MTFWQETITLTRPILRGVWYLPHKFHLYIIDFYFNLKTSNLLWAFLETKVRFKPPFITTCLHSNCFSLHSSQSCALIGHHFYFTERFGDIHPPKAERADNWHSKSLVCVITKEVKLNVQHIEFVAAFHCLFIQLFWRNKRDGDGNDFKLTD